MFGFDKQKQEIQAKQGESQVDKGILSDYEDLIALLEKDVAQGKQFSAEEVVKLAETFSLLGNIPDGGQLVERANKTLKKFGIMIVRTH